MKQDNYLNSYIDELSETIDFNIPEICIDGIKSNILLLQEYSRLIHKFCPITDDK